MFDPWEEFRAVDPISQRPTGTRRQKNEKGKFKRRKTSILVVDDERLIADTMTEILRRSGYAASCAYDGKSALQLALQLTPDVVLTDVVMPHMNGVQLAIAIRQSLPSAEIILLSGQAGVTDLIERGRKDGYSFEIIAKPVHPERLLQRLQQR